MKLFNKTALALAFSTLGAISSMSAIAMVTDEVHVKQRIEVIAEDDKNVQVFVSIDGDITDLELTKEQLADPQLLDDALVDVPDEVREKLISQLSNIQMNGDMIKIKTDSTGSPTWVEHESEHVFVIKEAFGDDGTDIAKKVIKKLHKDGTGKVVQFKHGSSLSAKSIVHILEQAKLSPEELDTIQQALDKKR